MSEQENNVLLEESVTAFFGAIAKAGELEYYLSDLFIVYDVVVQMQPGEKAVIMTRLSGCERLTQTEGSFDWSGKRSFYLITRLPDWHSIPYVSYARGSEAEAKCFLDRNN